MSVLNACTQRRTEPPQARHGAKVPSTITQPRNTFEDVSRRQRPVILRVKAHLTALGGVDAQAPAVWALLLLLLMLLSAPLMVASLEHVAGEADGAQQMGWVVGAAGRGAEQSASERKKAEG